MIFLAQYFCLTVEISKNSEIQRHIIEKQNDFVLLMGSENFTKFKGKPDYLKKMAYCVKVLCIKLIHFDTFFNFFVEYSYICTAKTTY